MPTIKIKLDDNKGLIKAFEKRTVSLEKAIMKFKPTGSQSQISGAVIKRIRLLEKLLKESKKKPSSVVDTMNSNQSKQIRAMHKNTDRLLSAFGTRNFTRGISVIPSPS